MPELRKIACLAASLKHGGFCYAGKDVATGEWIRPISDADGHAISAYYRVVGKADPAKVGDILAMKIGQYLGEGYQTENYAHVKEHWRRVGTFSYSEAQEMCDEPVSLWADGRSTKHGIRDEISETEASEFDFSLCLIEVDDLTVICSDEGYDDVKKRLRADFTYRGTRYRLRITDPEHFNYDMGEHEIGRALLCCSLAEPFEWDDGSRHISKLVAAILLPD